MYAEPFWTATRVGVLPPVVAPLIALLTAVALFPAIGISTPLFTPQVPPFGEVKNLRPQFTSMSVDAMTCVTALIVCDHFEFAPQLFMQEPSADAFMDPDRSSISRMSGGSLASG